MNLHSVVYFSLFGRSIVSEGPVIQDPYCSSLGFRGNPLMELSKDKKSSCRGVYWLDPKMIHINYRCEFKLG